MNNVIIEKYEGNDVSFLKGKNMMVNATEMAKPFGKMPKDWLKTQSAKDFLKAMTERKKILSTDLVQVTYGNDGGTWVQEDVALEFARWLSPDFAIWCNDKIKELLTTGITTLSVPKTFAQALRLAADQQEEIERQQKLIEEQKPKADYFDNLVERNLLTNFRDTAKQIGIKQTDLINKLLENGYI